MPKPKHGYDKPLTEKGKLSDRGKAKLRGQIQKAEMIMNVEKMEHRGTSKTFYQAQDTRNRAQDLLDKDVSPDKKESKKKPKKKEDGAARRRKPFEKATGTGRLKEALIGVAKRAQQANEK